MIMKQAENQQEAFNKFRRHNKNDAFIQWKGTNVCMDFHCDCGKHNHYDGYFAHAVECSGCGQKYASSCYIEMVKIKEDSNPLRSID